MGEIEFAVDRVAGALRWLEHPPVFVGGATIGLFLDDFAKAQMRPTKDVDCILPGANSYTSWARIEAQLRRRGWSWVSAAVGIRPRWRTRSGARW